ncbi:MAG: SRPBCC domain-containing protein [Gulosibacter sp.]|uniref:SRPBCC domain-containing protein n=1 Tax=Gulosibacter sp. TaxID=2817531 RepID=UPI003F903351
MSDSRPDEAILKQIHAPIEVRLDTDESGSTLTMRREFSHSAGFLWQMLTESELLNRWSPIVPDRAFDSLGPSTSRESPDTDPFDTEVLVVDRPRKLAHRWGEETIQWTIFEGPEGASLEMRQTLLDRSFASLAASGWRVCFGRLAAEEDGVERERVVGERALAYGFDELNEQYAAQFGYDAK